MSKIENKIKFNDLDILNRKINNNILKKLKKDFKNSPWDPPRGPIPRGPTPGTPPGAREPPRDPGAPSPGAPWAPGTPIRGRILIGILIGIYI